MNIHELGEALDALDQSISLMKSALATVDLQMQTVAHGFAAFEQNAKRPMPASLAAIETQQARMNAMLPPDQAVEKMQPTQNQAEFKAPIADLSAERAAPVMPKMPDTQPRPAVNPTPDVRPAPPMSQEPAKPLASADPTPTGPSDSDFTLAIAKMSRSYNGFLGGEVQKTLAQYGIEPPNGVLSVPMERRYEFLDALEATAKEEAAS